MTETTKGNETEKFCVRVLLTVYSSNGTCGAIGANIGNVTEKFWCVCIGCTCYYDVADDRDELNKRLPNYCR